MSCDPWLGGGDGGASFFEFIGRWLLEHIDRRRLRGGGGGDVFAFVNYGFLGLGAIIKCMRVLIDYTLPATASVDAGPRSMTGVPSAGAVPLDGFAVQGAAIWHANITIFASGATVGVAGSVVVMLFGPRLIGRGHPGLNAEHSP